MPELDHKRTADIDGLRNTPLMTFTTDFGLSIRVSMFEYVRLVTGTSVLPGPLKWARAETGRAE